MGSETDIDCAFTGQSLIKRPFDPSDPSRFRGLREWIGDASVRFTNLEVTVVDERPPWPTWDSTFGWSDPSVIDELAEYGFNLYALCNNHAWDAATNGVLDTLEGMESRSLAHAGTGRDLGEAESPALLETEGGSVALLGMAAGFLPPAAYATPEAKGGRPGINPLLVDSYYEVPDEDYERLQRIDDEFVPDYTVWEGFDHIRKQREYDHHPRLSTNFVRGEGFGMRRIVDEDDEKRHLENVRRAREAADLVLVYLHHHYWERDPREVSDWVRRFARSCIDAGADGFITHGVPELLPIELYEGKPICYSLGNFVFHLGSEIEGRIQPGVSRSVAIRGRFRGGEWHDVRAKPVILVDPSDSDGGSAGGWDPMVAEGAEGEQILSDLQEISSTFGTDVEVVDGEARIAG